MGQDNHSDFSEAINSQRFNWPDNYFSMLFMVLKKEKERKKGESKRPADGMSILDQVSKN